MSSLWGWLASTSLAELQNQRRRLDDEYGARLAQLDSLEARKTELDQRGAVERSLRGQQTLAHRVADLDHQAELVARLLRLIGKQQRLLDRVIWAKDSAERLEALRAAAPAAVELDWPDLARAAEDASGTEARLDALLRILGVPEEEWPKSAAPPYSRGDSPAVTRDPAEPVLVAEVLDGRTLRLVTGEVVRYIGVDAPLLEGALGRPDIGAHEAWLANRRLVEGQYVRLESDSEDRDPDGALWRYVWLGNKCANAEMIRQGFAYHDGSSANRKHSEWFGRLEKQAKHKKRGLWE